MNYLEIADAYDKQADAVLAMSETVKNHPGGVMQLMHEAKVLELELRTKAADLRAAVHDQERRRIRDERNQAAVEFDQTERLKWMELQAKNTESMALQAKALVEIASKNLGQRVW